MKRNIKRAAHLSPHPNDKVWQKHKLLHVQEKGDLAVQRSLNRRQWKSSQLQRLAKELRAEWQKALHQHIRSLERLYRAHLLGVGGRWAREHDSGGQAQRGAAWQPRAWKKQSTTSRGERWHKEELVRLNPWCTKSWRRVGGMEKNGASKVVGLPHPSPSPPDKNQGKWGPSRKTSGGHCPSDPQTNGGLGTRKLWTTAGGVMLQGEREKDLTQSRRRQPGRTARQVPGLENNCLGQSPKGSGDDLEQLGPVSSTHGWRALPQASLCQCGGKSKWQRELQWAFEQLFNINRKLKRHLTFYLECRLGLDVHPSEERGFSEVHRHQGATQREKTVADAKTEMVTAGGATHLARVDTCQSLSRADLQKLLSKLGSQNYQMLVKPTSKEERSLLSPKAGTPVSEESPLWRGLEFRCEPARLDALSLQLHLPEQVDRAGSVASRQKHRREQRRLTQLELLGPPGLSLETHSQTSRESERGKQMRARPAHSKGFSSWNQEKEGGCEHGPAFSPASSGSTTDDEGSRHSWRLRDLQQQIVEQNKLHKQFLEEARKHLREFQMIC
ncbi:protein DDC8 homolog [Saccopteryx bilineata]|uniref:protein DDC8 homolog n=1 Tax=Saccopteryx bilineata TaxID=59482 RepID=UPI00338DE403